MTKPDNKPPLTRAKTQPIDDADALPDWPVAGEVYVLNLDKPSNAVGVKVAEVVKSAGAWVVRYTKCAGEAMIPFGSRYTVFVSNFQAMALAYREWKAKQPPAKKSKK